MEHKEMDIYFTEGWQETFAKRDRIDASVYELTTEYGTVKYIYGKRKVCIDGIDYPYYDIVTPYAFSGPCFAPADNTEECMKNLSEAYKEDFSRYCKEEHIIAEFVQFNPWVQNSRYLEDAYEMDFRSVIVGIDLTKEIWMEEFRSSTRRAIRKAMKNGAEIFFDEEGIYIDEFLRLYDFTVDKYDTTSYYRFSKEFLLELFARLRGHLGFCFCKFGERITNATLYLKWGDYSHGFLAGNDPAMNSLNGNSLVLYSISEKMKQEGCKVFILGGGDPNLTDFKNAFTKDCFFDYYSGKKIFDFEKYEEFKRLNGVQETKFFPAYRDNGKVKYKHWKKDE